MTRAYLHGQRFLSIALVVIGVGMTVSTLVRGGGPFSLGVVLGILFAGLGIARFMLARQVGGSGSK